MTADPPRDVVLYADTIRSPELRHEVPVAVFDPFLYAEADGARHVLVHAAEALRMEGLGIALHTLEEYGFDELRASGLAYYEIALELVLRACESWGIRRALVPPTFPIELTDALRGRGVELVPDRGHFVARRRVKTEAELAGIRRAVAAAEAGLGAVASLLADAQGEPLTCERLKRTLEEAVSAQGCAIDDTIVSHGAQTAVAHELGSGAIAPGEPILVDLAPRDRDSGCHADLTRTFVVGEPPGWLVELQELVQEALDLALRELRPGARASDVNRAVCELFEGHGYPTALTKKPGVPLLDGFFHSLGHGVGLEVHEAPYLGLSDKRELLEGEVLAVEPGLYDRERGGVRLEDVVLVTAGGAERLSTLPYALEPAPAAPAAG